MRKKIYIWLDERFQLGKLTRYVKEKDVPVHRGTVWYFMGGVALFLFIIQVFTGILLVLYYRADADSAFESVHFLMTEVSFGWLIRSIHSWAANLMVLIIFIHMFSTFFNRTFRKPRELTWVTGFILLALTFGFGFTGYLLPWNELSFFATKVGTDIAGAVPFIGNAVKTLLRGGEEVTGATLSRFYAIHIALIPAIFTMFLGAHLLFVQRQGMHAPDTLKSNPDGKPRTMPFFPNFLLRDLLLWLIVLNVLLYLAVFLPWELGEKADAFAPAKEGIRPEWYFMFMFQTLKIIPAHVLFMEGEVLGVVLFGLGAVVWMLVPFWLRSRHGNGRDMRVIVVGLVVVLYILAMTIWGYVH